jgi:hypothetical protein
MSMKNSNDTIENRTRDLPACSAVPQPTALPREIREVREVNHSPPSSVKVKNECSYVSAPPVHLHGAHRDYVALYSVKYLP